MIHSASYYPSNQEVINSINEINEKLETEENGKQRTKLLFEQMLRGIKLNYF